MDISGYHLFPCAITGDSREIWYLLSLGNSEAQGVSSASVCHPLDDSNMHQRGQSMAGMNPTRFLAVPQEPVRDLLTSFKCCRSFI